MSRELSQSAEPSRQVTAAKAAAGRLWASALTRVILRRLRRGSLAGQTVVFGRMPAT
jgi:hypothetical protein